MRQLSIALTPSLQIHRTRTSGPLGSLVDYLVANGPHLLCGFMDDVVDQSMQNTLEAAL